MLKRPGALGLMVLAFSIWHLALMQAPPYSLALYLLGHRIGEEHCSNEPRGDSTALTCHFEYLDRGAAIALDTALAFSKDFTALSFESHGKSYRYFSVDASVPSAPGRPNTFTIDGMVPVAAQAVLVRYWLSNGRPQTRTALPSGDAIRIREVPEASDLKYLNTHP